MSDVSDPAPLPRKLSTMTGPELFIVGAARSGTSFLAAHLSAHPRIDPPSVKEPSFFSRHFDKGLDYYDGFFPSRADGHVRMDASTTYTFPQFPDALARVAECAKPTLIVYVVRDPLERAYSHYRHEHDYFGLEKSEDPGMALRENPVFLGASDYGHWLPLLYRLFGDDRILIMPFRMITAECATIASTICERLGLGPWHQDPADDSAAYRNDVVSFRNGLVRTFSERIRRSRVYPKLRKAIGPTRVRKLRSLLTRQAPAPTLAEVLDALPEAQRNELQAFADRARSTVDTYLRAQDERLCFNWFRHWSSHHEGGRTER